MNTSMNVHKSINFTVLTYFPAKASLDIMYVCIDDNKNHLKVKTAQNNGLNGFT